MKIDAILPTPLFSPLLLLPIFPDMNHPDPMTGQDSNCTSIARATLSTWMLYSYPLLLALNEIQQPALETYPGAVIGANDGAIQAPSDNMQDSFDSLFDFDS